MSIDRRLYQQNEKIIIIYYNLYFDNKKARACLSAKIAIKKIRRPLEEASERLD
ncbi:hypothetical protein QY95_01977 [Bacillus thermotolerans]|uniref:Uncharacterized protein n=1 Tax=Bacillus thermotolerans TaxID=1221996 RepID=A0A0F5I3B4_BACTR|nr:hypothetical protein QY95_01977 [Bacillus thermotolerans]